MIENYKDVAKGLKTINDHYQEGKKVYGSTKDHFNKELKESYDYLIESSKLPTFVKCCRLDRIYLTNN